MIEPFSEELRQLHRQVEALFSRQELCEENADPDFCRSLVREMGATGLLKHVAPAPSVRTLCFLRYAIAEKTALGDLLFAMQGLGSYPISLAGTEAQKQKYLSRVVDGTRIAAFALTEPEAGSDAGAMRLSAEKDGDGYRLQGKKTLI